MQRSFWPSLIVFSFFALPGYAQVSASAAAISYFDLGNAFYAQHDLETGNNKIQCGHKRRSELCGCLLQ